MSYLTHTNTILWEHVFVERLMAHPKRDCTPRWAMTGYPVNARRLCHPNSPLFQMSHCLSLVFKLPSTCKWGKAHTCKQIIISFLCQVSAWVLICERKGPRWISRKHYVLCIYSSQQQLPGTLKSSNFEDVLNTWYAIHTCKHALR